MEEQIRTLAQEYLGTEITSEEFEEAYPAAKKKLDWIISREGDANGERNDIDYIAQLVSEYLKQKAFSIFTLKCCQILLDDGLPAPETT